MGLTHSAPSALEEVLSGWAPGPMAQAVTFRTFGAQEALPDGRATAASHDRKTVLVSASGCSLWWCQFSNQRRQ
jgi:hypothetical protein